VILKAMGNRRRRLISHIVLCSLLLNATPSFACKGVLQAVWDWSGEAVGAAGRFIDRPALQVYSLRSTRSLSAEAYDVFRRGIFENKPLTLADREILEKEHAQAVYDSLKAAPRWVQTGNLIAGAYDRSKLSPKWEMEKAATSLTHDLPALAHRLNLAPLIYKAHYYKDKLHLTPGDLRQLKAAGVNEAGLRALAEEIKDKKYGDYPDYRKELEDEIAAKRKHMLTTFALEPLQLARRILMIPNLVKDHKTHTLEGKLLSDPNYELKPLESLLDRLWGRLPGSKKTSFDEIAFAEHTHGMIEELKRLRSEIEAHPGLYKNMHQLRDVLTWTIRGLAVSALLFMKFGMSQTTLDDSFDPDSDDGMKNTDADDGLVEMIYFPDTLESGIRIGNYVYHYDWGSMTRVDSLKLYAARARSQGDHVRIKIKMSQDEIAKLKEHLETQRERNFFHVPPFNTPEAMANQDLKAGSGIGVPTIIDRTHSTALPLFRAQKLLSDMGLTEDRIQSMTYASEDGSGRNLLQLGMDGVETMYLASNRPKGYLLYPLVEFLPKGKQTLPPARVEISREDYLKGLEAKLPWPGDPMFIDTLTDATPDEKKILLNRLLNKAVKEN